MSIDYNAIIIVATLGITPEELSKTIRSFPEEYANHTSSIEGILAELNEDYDVDEVISELSCIRSEVNDLMQLSEEVSNLISTIDEINEYNQAIYLADDFIKIIKKLKEDLENYLISNQDDFIAQVENFISDLEEMEEISYDEIEEIYNDIWAEFSTIELDMSECSDLL